MQDTADGKLVSIALRVNGESRTLDVEPRWTLADVLRDHLDLTGLHLGCEQGACGACMVTIDGEPALSCMNLAIHVEGADIRTIEEISGGQKPLGKLEHAFIDKGAFQCGYCTPGFLIMGHHLVENGMCESREQVRTALSGNICRCTGYEPIVDAIMAAAEERKK